MGLPAARLGDPAAHGGIIVFGAPTVLIGGMPAARVGDPIACPGFTGPVPHIVGNITMGSTSVMIYGAFAARQTDMTGCGLMGVSGFTLPPIFGPPAPPPTVTGAINQEAGSVWGDRNVGFLYGEHSGYTNSDGVSDAVKGSFEHLGGTTNLEGGGSVTGTVDSLTGSAEYHSSNSGFGAGASAGVSVISAKGSVSNPNGDSVGASGGLFNAAAGIDALAGSDGRRTGVALGASLQASAAEGQVDSVSVFRIPFTNYSINGASTIGGSAGAVGGAGAAGAYHDAADDRYHLMGMIDLELVIGVKLGLDISFGQAPPPPPGVPTGSIGIGLPMTPGVVIMGCPNVLIG
jgi:uncharacterized Zn-binding protein involved in type VI secretion